MHKARAANSRYCDSQIAARSDLLCLHTGRFYDFRPFADFTSDELTELRQDLARFTFLLDNDDGGQPFGTDQN